MKKLLLTSCGLCNKKIINVFLKAAGKSMRNTKVLFIPTAARTKEEIGFTVLSKQELLDQGILISNIEIYNLDKPKKYEEVKKFDVMYICGGNTFYLLKKVRDNNFDEVIKKFVSDGKLYFGVSAGSLLVCPDIGIAVPFDDNDVCLNDYRGVGLVDVIVSPHYIDKEKSILDNSANNSQYKIIPLTDEQAFYVTDKNEEIVG